jgi:hypothetical protein
LRQLFEALTGQQPPNEQDYCDVDPCFPAGGLGYSQLNELLLLLGYDRVSKAFFQFLVDGSLEYQPDAELKSIDALEQGVDRARKLSLLFFGNVKFGFKKLAQDVDELAFYSEAMRPVEIGLFESRHQPILPVEPIPPGETYYLGYVIQKEIDDRLTR